MQYETYNKFGYSNPMYEPLAIQLMAPMYRHLERHRIRLVLRAAPAWMKRQQTKSKKWWVHSRGTVAREVAEWSGRRVGNLP